MAGGNNREPIVVAQIMGKWLGGGVEAVIMNYYRHINHDKVQFDFICDEDSTNIPYEEIEKLGGKVILCPPYRKLGKYTKFLEDLFREKKYRIVHSNINTLSVFPLRAAKKAGVPVRIAHSHSTSNPKEIKRNLLKLALRKFSKKYATNYFACSEKAGRFQFGNKAFDSKQVDVISNAIEVDKFKYDRMARNKIREELGIAEEDYVIGHIGRFVTVKNHAFLIDLLAEVKKNNPNTRLVLVGKGQLENKIKKKVNTMHLEKDVFFLGQRNDTDTIYSAFDVFCLPSLYEGLPVVGIEAQASGLKCVFSDKITKEVKITGNVIFKKLNDNLFSWSSEIIESKTNDKSRALDAELVKRQFDSSAKSKQLEAKYETLLRSELMINQKKNDCKFSIIIPAFNVEEDIEQCIESVLAQSYTNYEIIIVDDGSTDGTGYICDQYCNKYDFIRTVHGKNQGAASARNIGLKHATGDYVLFADGDDYWVRDDFLERAACAIGDNDILIFNSAKYYGDGRYSRPRFRLTKDTSQMNGKDMKEFIIRNNIYKACPWDKVVKTSILKNNNILFPVGMRSEDIMWAAMLLEKIETIALCEDVFYAYRQREGSVTRTINEKHIDDMIRQLEVRLDDDIANSYLAYEYSVLLVYAYRASREQRDRMKQMIYLLDNKTSDKVKKVRLIYKIVGFNMTTLILHLFVKARAYMRR